LIHNRAFGVSGKMAMRDMLMLRRSRISGAADVRAPSAMGDPERLALLETFESSDLAWFWATDAAGHVSYLSPNASARFGPDVAVVGTPLVELVETVAEDGMASGERPLNFLLASHTGFQDVVVRLVAGGREEWWQLNGRPYVDAAQDFCGFRGSAKDVTEQFVRQRNQARLAQYDQLTGLANRHRMQQRLEGILSAFKLA
jgi:PAS domain-containing protein